MNKQQIEEFMDELSVGRTIRQLPSEDRKKMFQQLVSTAPEFSAKQFSKFGLKGTFGLSDQHREKISIGIRASLEKKKRNKSMNTDHIIHNSDTQRMECQHCGFSEAIKMPAPIDAIVGKMDAFTKAHEGCRRPQSEAVMSDYIKGFDAGYGYVLNEIERYINVYPTDVFAVKELLAHLKMEDKLDGTPPNKS